MKPYFVVAKTNLQKTTWIAYLIAGAGVLGIALNLVLDLIFSPYPAEDIDVMTPRWSLYIICIIAPALIAVVNYQCWGNLGVSDKNFFIGCFLDYVFYAAVISLIGVALHGLIEPALARQEIYLSCPLDSIFEQCHNEIAYFLLQFSFLLALECICHTLAFIQDKWYGWLADAVIVFLICSCVVTGSFVADIGSLVGLVFDFFFTDALAAVQIVSLFALALLVYATNLFYLPRKK